MRDIGILRLVRLLIGKAVLAKKKNMRIHTILYVLVACCFGVNLYAQPKDPATSFFVFDKDWKGCKPEEGVYLGCLRKFDDTTYEWRYYHYKGPLLSVETYKDKEANIPHGKFAFYGADGVLDSMGYTANGKKDQKWYHYTADGIGMRRIDEYRAGVLIGSRDSITLKAERDSLKRLRDGKPEDPYQTEASFKNGDEGWIKYVQRNIKYPERAAKLGITGKIIIEFVVDKEGNLSDFFFRKSVEYSIDEETLRLLKKSPKWIPARQFGKMVRAYRLQPLIFVTP